MTNQLTTLIEQSFILETASAAYGNSFLLPVVTFPMKECYINWKNVFINEYRTRSFIRAMFITISFTTGPILISLGKPSWLYDRIYFLYNGIPILNQLSEAVGVAISCSFIFSYFCAWAIVLATNFFNHYRFGGADHYLTSKKKQELLTIIQHNRFQISIKEIEEIFKKINLQLRKHPDNLVLHDLVNNFRKGDLQTALDHACLLEAEIALLNNKIELLSKPHQKPGLLDLQDQLPGQELQQLQPRLITHPPPPRNSLSIPDGYKELNYHASSSSSNQFTQISENILQNIGAEAEQSHSINFSQQFLATNQLTPEAVIYQYKHKKKFKYKQKFARAIDNQLNVYQQTVKQLTLHQKELKEQRYISPSKNFRVALS